MEEQWSLLPAPPPRGRVTSSFGRAINLVIAGQPLSILARGLGRSPGALALADRQVPRVTPGSAVTIAGDVVTISYGPIPEARIDTSEAAHYSSRVVTLRDIDAPTDDTLAAARAALAKVARRGSFIVVSGSAGDGFPPQASATLRERAAALRCAVTAQLRAPNGDDRPVREAADRLIGLGAGLTPSGDDCLVGWLAVLTQSARGDRPAAAIGASIATAGPGATTEVSRAYLHAATQHRFHEDLAAAARSCLLGDIASLRTAFARVATVGATSGTDSLTGVLDALNALAV